MGLESATYINGLVDTNPTTTDNANQGDNHLRLIKSVLKNTFPNLTGAVTVSQTVLNTPYVPIAGGTITGNIVASGGAQFVGNASTATTLQTARTINGVSFNGSANITFGTDAVAEGATNLYFTNARARSAISTAGSLSYNSTTGVISYSEAVSSVAGKTGAVTLAIADVANLQTTLDSKPSNTGTGASGTWGISISGNAATATSCTAAQYATNSGTAVNVSGVVAVANGGTGADNAATARTNLGAAARGANSDITSLSGLTTALSIAQGGTGATTAAAALSALGGVGLLAASLSSSSGYISLNIGGSTFKLQWVTSYIGTNSTITVSYPTSYSSWSQAWVSGMPNDPGPYQNPPGIVANSASTTGVQVVNGWDSVGTTVTVFSIGV